MTPTDPPNPSERLVLDYRSPAATTPVPRFEPRTLLRVSLILGALSWMALCGVGAVGVWLALALAALGLVIGVIAATRPLPRDATASVMLTMFMNFSVLAIWLIARVLL